ncbi:ORF6N domain-containing protein [bacterium]|nr:ORF6N domain-containing protein [bacterium]
MALVSLEQIERSILNIRGYRVLLDVDLAKIYGVSTKRLNEQVKRNLMRFPEDFLIQLSENEAEFLRSQNATSNEGRGGRRYLPYAFTEHGSIMLANILNSSTAVEASNQVVRAFIHLRQMISSHTELARKLDELERKYDSQFQSVFNAIRQLMVPRGHTKSRIGIHSDE